MDDGLQHHTLHRDLSLLVLDALQPLGNGRVLPAGPLREPFARTLGRSDAVCAVAPYADGTGARVAAPPSEAALRDVLGLPQHQHAEGGLGLVLGFRIGLDLGSACRHTSTLRPPAWSAAARRAHVCRGAHAWLRVALGAAEEQRGRSGGAGRSPTRGCGTGPVSVSVADPATFHSRPDMPLLRAAMRPVDEAAARLAGRPG